MVESEAGSSSNPPRVVANPVYNDRMLEPLNNAQRRKLKGLAQSLEATLKVGKSGLSPAFVQSLNTELERHELVKVKFADFKERRKELAPELAEKSGAHLIALVGHVAVLYRARAASVGSEGQGLAEHRPS